MTKTSISLQELMGEIYSKAKTIDSWLIGGYALLRMEQESHIKENLTYGFMWQ